MNRGLALPLAAALACAPSLLPGTDIQDNKDTRAIAAQVEAYRQAAERLDPEGVLALTAPDYFDNSGSTTPQGAVNRAGLEKRLQDLKELEELHFQITLRRIDVRGDVAEVEVFFDQFYRVKTPNGNVVPRHDADIHRFVMKKVQGKWLFVSGL